MNESIFSTYSTGENRVTASILAVIRCLALPRIDRILGALIGDSEFELVRFQNQPPGINTTPDAVIASSCQLLLETKLKRNDLRQEQLEGHLKLLSDAKETVRQLLVLTPDDECPELLNTCPDLLRAMKEDRLIWNNFVALNQAIDDLLRDEKEVISEREQFLLRELQKMMLAEKLLGSSKEVLVIPARQAWDFYKQHRVYSCPFGRAFQQVKYIAFYAGNEIHPLIPRILDESKDGEPVIVERGKYSDWRGEVVNQMLDRYEAGTLPAGWDLRPGRDLKVFLLSAPDAAETVKLGKPIINDLTSRNGQRIAFTQNRRYVSLDALRKAKTTSDLEED